MAERIVDAALSDGAGTALFLLTDQYVVYDYGVDRVRDGIRAIGSLPPGNTAGVPQPPGVTGPDTVIDAALRGKRSFDGRWYFFAGGSFVGLTTATGAFDPAYRTISDGWTVPAGSRFTAAWNGALNRDAFCYLFSDGQYLRYLWDEDRTDDGYPKPISNMIGIPAAFALGVDAAVDGGGAFSDASYLFRDDQYLRFQWVADGEPHGDGQAAIAEGWPGLQELLLAGKAKSHGLRWLEVTRSRIAAHGAGTLPAADEAVLDAAMLAHFKTPVSDAASVTTVDAMLAALQVTLGNSASVFRFRDPAQALADGVTAGDSAYFEPGSRTINVTKVFPSRPELNRVSSVLHEAVHANDPQSGTPNVHISEWYVTAGAAPALGLTPVPDMPTTTFATRYDLMSTADSLHDPSSYATFARHVFFGRDSRENI